MISIIRILLRMAINGTGNEKDAGVVDECMGLAFRVAMFSNSIQFLKP